MQKNKINIENLGLISDPRPEVEKKRDWKAEELIFFAPFIWKETLESQWKKYPIFYQDGSSSCVWQAITKALGVENYLEEKKFIHLSARDGYTRRSNYPQPGTYYPDGMNTAHKIGSTLEQLMPSQGLDESMMNVSSDRTPACELISSILKGGNWITLPNDIDSIASIVEPNGKPVVLGVRFNDQEWFGKTVPEIIEEKTKYGHGICVTNATLYKGKKSLIIEDSAYYNAEKESVRIITEDWFKARRISFAGYFQFLSNQGLSVREKPQHKFEVNLKQGMSNEEVVWLKKCLNYLKMFPDGTFTQAFEGATLYAVQLFQKQYQAEISGLVGYTIACTGNVLSGTRKMLNKLFG